MRRTSQVNRVDARPKTEPPRAGLMSPSKPNPNGTQSLCLSLCRFQLAQARQAPRQINPALSRIGHWAGPFNRAGAIKSRPLRR
jgi:hypothetical protein